MYSRLAFGVESVDFSQRWRRSLSGGSGDILVIIVLIKEFLDLYNSLEGSSQLPDSSLIIVHAAPLNCGHSMMNAMYYSEKSV